MSTVIPRRVSETEGYTILTIDGKLDAPAMGAVIDNILKVPNGPFVIYIASGGGSITHGNSVCELLKSFDVPVTFISRGLCASMAAIMPHYGDFMRLALPGTSFMYHAARYSPNGNEQELTQGLPVAFRENELIDKGVRNAIGLTKAQWKKYDGADIRLTDEECLHIGKHGMLDGIIVKDNRKGSLIIRTREGLKAINILKDRRSHLPSIPVIK